MRVSSALPTEGECAVDGRLAGTLRRARARRDSAVATRNTWDWWRHTSAATRFGPRSAASAVSNLERLRYPAGLDLGGRGPEEVALSIIGEIVQRLAKAAEARTPASSSAPAASGAAGTAIDPVCHMAVNIARARHVDRAARRHVLLLLRWLPHAFSRGSATLPRARTMTSAADIRPRFRDRGFVVDDAFATALEIMLALQKPLLIEGPAGVGKTESAKVLADALETRLIRLQCYEGLDAMSALYEWNYPRQMLHARLSESDRVHHRGARGGDLLRSLPPQASAAGGADGGARARAPHRRGRPCGRSVRSLPAGSPRRVAGDHSRARDDSGPPSPACHPHQQPDARALGCAAAALPVSLVAVPTLEQEIEILRARVPGLSDRLADRIAHLMQVLRGLPLQKAPGVAESLDWAMALMSLHREHLDARTLEQTLGCVLKVHEDHAIVLEHQRALGPYLADAPATSEAGGRLSRISASAP